MRISSFRVTISSLCLLSLTSGCLYEIRDEFVECEMWISNHFRASSRWDSCAPVYESMDYAYDFKKGFMAGYHAAANGANHCPPPLPPPCYWKAKYQSPEGKCQTNAWFDGYTHGAIAAESDGVAEDNRIVTRGRIADESRQSGPHIELPNNGRGMLNESVPKEPTQDYSIPPLPNDSNPTF